MFAGSLLWLWAAHPALVYADIFLSHDQDGRAVFSDRPPFPGAVPFLTTPREAAAPAAVAMPEEGRGAEVSLGEGGFHAGHGATSAHLPEQPVDGSTAQALLAQHNKSFRSED